MCETVTNMDQPVQTMGKIASTNPVSMSFVDRIKAVINARRRDATRSLVKCGEAEALLQKSTLSFEDVEKLGEFYYGY